MTEDEIRRFDQMCLGFDRDPESSEYKTWLMQVKKYRRSRLTV